MHTILDSYDQKITRLVQRSQQIVPLKPRSLKTLHSIKTKALSTIKEPSVCLLVCFFCSLNFDYLFYSDTLFKFFFFNLEKKKKNEFWKYIKSA